MNLMSDGVDCSIWMPFGQFMSSYLRDDGDFSDANAGHIRDAFIDALELKVYDGPLFKRMQSLSEKDWAQAWVCLDCLRRWLVFDFSLNTNHSIPSPETPHFLLHCVLASYSIFAKISPMKEARSCGSVDLSSLKTTRTASNPSSLTGTFSGSP